jgi:cytosine permease
MSSAPDREHIGNLELEAEFERVPVPQQHRKSLRTVAAVWFGFPMILTCAVFGGVLAALLGFQRAILAIAVGNLVLFAYVGTLSYFAGRTGLNFALQARRVFGRLGQLLVAGFLSTLVIGWFAFNTGLTGATMEATFGWTEWLVTLVAALAYVAITFVGVRALSVIGMIAAPLFVVVSIIAIVIASEGVTLSSVWNYEGAGAGVGAFSLGAGITLVIATFADSGTMTADFTRWARNGREAVLAASTAFPIANFCAFVVGAIVVATGVVENAAVNGGNFVPLLANDQGALLTVLSVLFVFVSLGSVSTHCLYNAAVGWSNLTHTRMRTMCLALGAIGTIAATAGVWSHFLDWLNVLGVFVPPIGAVIIADQVIAHRLQQAPDEKQPIRPFAFVAYASGATAAGLLHYLAPEGAEAVVGIVVAGGVYTALALGAHRRVEAVEPELQVQGQRG